MPAAVSNVIGILHHTCGDRPSALCNRLILDYNVTDQTKQQLLFTPAIKRDHRHAFQTYNLRNLLLLR